MTTWKSDEDVAKWLDENFRFDKNRQSQVKRSSDSGSGFRYRNPETVYETRAGFCADAANFAVKNLNTIDPSYGARWVFIRNALGYPHHWVAAYYKESKLYIMDYGAGPKWTAMMGTHGPYNSLSEYKAFLASKSIPDFRVGDVFFRDPPGSED